ncbi:hypothetical protein [Psychromonas sp. SP041]|uniref:hypothetical protein n=1 Tax=Psychromonas sp. SP041 TaxID=1365007 RepID=UPI0010C7BC06|nr:hypothetical protein [Psychromonas sp. SP041]
MNANKHSFCIINDVLNDRTEGNDGQRDTDYLYVWYAAVGSAVSNNGELKKSVHETLFNVCPSWNDDQN